MEDGKPYLDVLTKKLRFVVVTLVMPLELVVILAGEDREIADRKVAQWISLERSRIRRR